MTISFHHAFREGDKVIMTVVDTLAKLGFKNLTLASSSLLNCHDPLIEHIQEWRYHAYLHLRPKG